jgi:hypothetical protein
LAVARAEVDLLDAEQSDAVGAVAEGELDVAPGAEVRLDRINMPSTVRAG